MRDRAGVPVPAGVLEGRAVGLSQAVWNRVRQPGPPMPGDDRDAAEPVAVKIRKAWAFTVVWTILPEGVTV